jgi:hypothetical protein
VALLSKWKWRFLDDGEAVWLDLLRFRYGHFSTRLLSWDWNINGARESLWLKDVTGIGREGEVDLFKSNVGCGVGNNNNIGFSKFKWFGNQPFRDLFPNIFLKEAFQMF